MPTDRDHDLEQMTKEQATATMILQRVFACLVAALGLLLLIEFDPQMPVHWASLVITVVCVYAAYRSYKWHANAPRDTSCDDDADLGMRG